MFCVEEQIVEKENPLSLFMDRLQMWTGALLLSDYKKV